MRRSSRIALFIAICVVLAIAATAILITIFKDRDPEIIDSIDKISTGKNALDKKLEDLNVKDKTSIQVNIKYTTCVKEETSVLTNVKETTGINKETSKEENTKSDTPKPVKQQDIIFKKGDKGSNITEIQRKLSILGYKLPLSGIYGEQTVTAVQQLQEKNSLTATGYIDTDTLQLLKDVQLIDTTKMRVTYTPADVLTLESKEACVNKNSIFSYTKYFIWVNEKTFTVNIFEGQQNLWKLIKECKCSIGSPKTPTITGAYELGDKGEYFISGSVRCKYYSQISGNYLFHSILFDKTGSTIVNGTLGAKLSHGCIRLKLEDAKYIYDSIPKGTTVIINE